MQQNPPPPSPPPPTTHTHTTSTATRHTEQQERLGRISGAKFDTSPEDEETLVTSVSTLTEQK